MIDRLRKHCSYLPVNRLPTLATVRHCFPMQGWASCLWRWWTRYFTGWQRWRIALALLLSPWFFFMIFSPAHAAAVTPAQGVEFILMYGNDVRGETDPCG